MSIHNAACDGVGHMYCGGGALFIVTLAQSES